MTFHVICFQDIGNDVASFWDWTTPSDRLCHWWDIDGMPPKLHLLHLFPKIICWSDSEQPFPPFHQMESIFMFTCVSASQSPWREAGIVWCLTPVWNLRAVIWFPFPISSLLLLPTPVVQSFCLVIFVIIFHSLYFFPKYSLIFVFEIGLFVCQ